MFFGGGRRRGPSGVMTPVRPRFNLEQASTGMETTIDVPRAEVCPTCSGSGARPGTSPVKALAAWYRAVHPGTEHAIWPRYLLHRMSQVWWKGADCYHAVRGLPRGWKGSPQTRSTSRSPRALTRGSISAQGQGEAAPEPGGQAGDLYVFINVRPHSRFTRSDSDLMLEAPISITRPL